jgi:tRNA threonylcarbamoyladenosine biosynthesis protein TsaB
MLVVTIKTDQPEAELGLFENNKRLGYIKWPAHRELAETIHKQFELLLGFPSKEIHQIGGIVCFEGPGSYTGLRIGLSVGNALSYSLGIPIVATRGEDWIKQGLAGLDKGDNEKTVLPFYGGKIHVTLPPT